MNWTLEVVSVPVSDVDAAKTFYAELLGFVVDHDTTIGPDNRIVQLTPPGSGCSIVIGTDVAPMKAGSLQGLQLVVADVHAARDELAGRGLDTGPVQVYAPDGLREERPGDELDNVGFLHFADPDGNGWSVQQISSRAAG